MARVTGIGGVFLTSPEPKKLAAWYAEHLGIELTPWGGTTFRWSDEVPPTTGQTAWSVFAKDTPYFGEGGATPSPQSVMIDYRVDDLDGLLEKLSAAGVWIDPKRDDADYGRFAWIRDCDGNRVELWQPLPIPQADENESAG